MTDLKRCTLPTPPDHTAPILTQHFCRLFLHEISACQGRAEDRILHAIGTTAQQSGAAAEDVATVLVDNGLRAPRQAFPAGFIRLLERAGTTPPWNVTAPSAEQKDLLQSWKTARAAASRQSRSSQPLRHRQSGTHLGRPL